MTNITHALVAAGDPLVGSTDWNAAHAGVVAAITETKLDDLTAADDNTDLNATTGHHGLLPKLGGGTSNYLRADGSWAAPGGTGSVATDAIWDAAGDLVQGTGADAAAKLSAGTAGQFLMSGGAAAANLWASREIDYAQKTSNTSITATTAGSADTIITGNAVAYDGATIVLIEFVAAFVTPPAGQDITIGIFESTTEVGRVCYLTAAGFSNVHGAYRLTPTAATHTYLVKAWVASGTGTVGAGAGGAAATPAFMRITRAK